MTKEKLAGMIGKFSWFYGQDFFIQTKDGNFVWNSPRYNGDGSIREYKGTFEQYVRKNGESRCKGEHLIGAYCGDFVMKE